MKARIALHCIVASLLLAGAPTTSRADQTNQPAAKPTREEIREQLMNMSPEERRAKIQELREKQMGQAKSKEPFKAMTAGQRRAQLKAQLEELRKKKADGTITPLEQKQLDRLEPYSSRLEAVPTGAPPASASTTNKPAAATPAETKSLNGTKGAKP